MVFEIYRVISELCKLMDGKLNETFWLAVDFQSDINIFEKKKNNQKTYHYASEPAEYYFVFSGADLVISKPPCTVLPRLVRMNFLRFLAFVSRKKMD